MTVDAKLLLPEAPLVILPSLAGAVGLVEAVILQQIHYRTRKSEGVWWPEAKGDLEATFPFWSESTIKRALGRLQRAGLVQVRQEGMDRTKRYRVQIDAMHRANLTANRPDASDQNGAIPISLNSKRVNGREGKSARTRHLDSFLR